METRCNVPVRTATVSRHVVTSVAYTQFTPGEAAAGFDTITNKQTNKQTPWPLVRERTIPTERPPLVDEI
jgi:hypothetical protein